MVVQNTRVENTETKVRRSVAPAGVTDLRKSFFLYHCGKKLEETENNNHYNNIDSNNIENNNNTPTERALRKSSSSIFNTIKWLNSPDGLRLVGSALVGGNLNIFPPWSALL